MQFENKTLGDVLRRIMVSSQLATHCSCKCRTKHGLGVTDM